ncbi:PREDICTED: glycine-rich RNA-binding protein 5, mitochondrial-like [Priapulus caudatus]|uniref:Glycine-rich RNA-binding protein 5, mitochondrial-like n=1 Tax=Priapulus caudatus TaxID=37621 RepID=A0ABM1DNP7_PRICU|nr:PREDICTED: glycine-rich RNA-binding protein 5, mitochondrial-like [Priapulus caudatus]
MKSLVVVVVLGCVAGVFSGSYGNQGGQAGAFRGRGSSFGGSSFQGGAIGGGSFQGGSVGGGSFQGGAIGGGNFQGGSVGGGSFQRRVSGGGSFQGGSVGGGGFRSGFGGGSQQSFNIDNFGNIIDASSFGIDQFGRNYINIDAFDFSGAFDAAQKLAPRESLTPSQREQIVIGRRYRSGSARQFETSNALREGSGNGQSGIDLSARRTASQDATQQFTQQATGEGATRQGATYGFERNNNGQIRFAPVKLDSLPVHAGPRSQVPRRSQKTYSK